MKSAAFALLVMPLALAAAPSTTIDPVGPDAARSALAEKVLVASGNDSRLAAIDKGIGLYKLLSDALQASLPGASPDKIDKSVAAEIQFEHAAIFAKNRDIYATRFSAAELTDMLAFYSSPGGKALVAQTPAIIHDKAAFGQELASNAIARMTKTACGDGTCPER